MQFMKDYCKTDDHIGARLLQLFHLEEKCDRAFHNLVKQQNEMKRWFDKNTHVKNFKVRDLVLLWDKVLEDKGKHAKFD